MTIEERATQLVDQSPGVILDTCSECGLVVGGGVAGCQRLFEDETVREYDDPRFAGRHRLVVDAYGLQHPDRYCVSAVSLAAHLTGICIAVEHDRREVVLNAAVQRWLSSRPRLDKPTLPNVRGSVTIADLRATSDVREHGIALDRWAADVWDAYRDLQSTARRWVDLALDATGVER